MKAGRELDAIIAEKVMGFIWDPGLPDRSAFPYPPEMAVGDAWPSAVGKQAEAFDQYVPHYSTDIAAAWEVVEKMRQTWERFAMTDEEAIHASFGRKIAGGYYMPGANGDTPAHAICLAALKAVGNE